MDLCLQRETPVAIVVRTARGLRRLTGLIAQPAPAPGTALLLRRCRSVHGWLMAHAIDVVFVDADFRVLKTARLLPWHTATCRLARHTIELRAGEVERLAIRPGRQIEIFFAQGG